MNLKPYDKIIKKLTEEIPYILINRLPDKWEKVGNVLTIKLHSDFNDYSLIIGKTYAEVLNCKTVLNDIGGITGEFRKPKVKIIYGSKKTETIHKENMVKYKLDPTKIMFSSGNINERIRMAHISNNSEIIVDLFAGIGYFSLPIAIHSKPKKIIAIEKNPISYKYLYQNISLNNVTDIIEPLKGDNRKIAPKNIANRVIMGYLINTQKYLYTAFECLKDYKGIIHYHDKFPEEQAPDKAIKIISNIAKKYNRKINILLYKNIKSYAPGINHYVFDIMINPPDI